MRSLYVDDFASGSRAVESALQLSTKVKTRLSDRGFNMRKWATFKFRGTFLHGGNKYRREKENLQEKLMFFPLFTLHVAFLFWDL